MRNTYQNEQEMENHRKLLNRKMKTIESIGTFNETPDNYDRSIVCKRDVFLNNPFSLEEKQAMTLSNISKISKVQSDLTKNISQNKTIYQSRINQKNSHIHNRSLQRSSNAKSVDRHSLKPTNTPNFNKFQNRKNAMSPLPNQKVQQKFAQKNISIEKITPSQLQMRQYYINGSSNKNTIECSQISSKFEDFQFGYDLHENQKSVANQNIHQKKYLYEYGNESTPKKILFSQNKPTYKHLQLQQPKTNFQKTSCDCDGTLKQFMEHTNNKMAQITQRLMHLQNQNYRLRKLQQRFNQSQNVIQNLIQKVSQMQSQNDSLKQSNLSCQAEKQQLQVLLKQVLFKRQKQKLQNNSQNSKQNTYRNQLDTIKVIAKTDKYQNLNTNERKKYQQDNTISQNSQEFDSNSYPEKQSPYNFAKKDNSRRNLKKGIQPLGTKILNSSSMQKSIQTREKPNDSKMKVQNLLSKLQIRIQKN